MAQSSDQNGEESMKTLSKFFADENAATAIEYGLIASGIAVAIIAVVNGLGTQLTAKFQAVSDGIK
jgi:pilus assembly protein Flp/PilA